MPLQYTDRRIIGVAIADAWQNHLQTEMDPADGRWFANGPGNNGGLYGSLVDTLATELVFDENRPTINRTKVIGTSGVADNRNGRTPKQVVTLSYTFQDSVTTSHSSSDVVKIGAALEMKAGFNIKAVKAEVAVKASIEYSHSWTSTTSVTKSESQTFTQSIPVDVPAGRVYEVVLLADKENIQIPYKANVYLSGQTAACFSSPVNGQKIWTADAGTLCEWIAKYKSAGDESHRYSRDSVDQGRGCISIEGVLKVTRTVKFIARTSDITETFTGSDQAAEDGANDQAGRPAGRVVSETAV